MLYLMRHGETALNTERRFRGWTEVQLSIDGIKEAQQAARFLADKHLDWIVCSSLLRTILTGNIIQSESLNAHICLAFEARPWNVGSFTGTLKSETEQALIGYVKQPDLVIPGGESLTAFRERWLACLNRWLRRAKTQNVVIVTHTSNIVAAVEQHTNKLLEPEGLEITKPGGIVSYPPPKVIFEPKL
jgi:probable phosphoglycerate mutase